MWKCKHKCCNSPMNNCICKVGCVHDVDVVLGEISNEKCTNMEPGYC